MRWEILLAINSVIFLSGGRRVIALKALKNVSGNSYRMIIHAVLTHEDSDSL